MFTSGFTPNNYRLCLLLGEHVDNNLPEGGELWCTLYLLSVHTSYISGLSNIPGLARAQRDAGPMNNISFPPYLCISAERLHFIENFGYEMGIQGIFPIKCQNQPIYKMPKLQVSIAATKTGGL